MANDIQLEQLKQKYASVLTAVEKQQVRLSHLHIQDNKLFLQGIAPSEEAKNKVWDQIKQINPNWEQDLSADISVDSSKAYQPPKAAAEKTHDQTYVVKAGDTLSKISQELYGKANAYMKIFEANRDLLSDPNKISPGQKLKIPT